MTEKTTTEKGGFDTNGSPLIIPPTKRKKNIDLNRLAFIIFVLAIPLFMLVVSWGFVNIKSFLMAFQLPTGEWSMETFEMVFLEMKMFGGEASLLISIRNTLIFFLKDLCMYPLHILVAYFLYKKIKGYKVFQIILYLPGIISAVAVTMAFKEFISPSGPLGQLLINAGVCKNIEDVPELLTNNNYAVWTVMFYTIWLGWGGNMLLLGGAMARIPVDLLESARLDGIESGKEIIYIIFPLIWPTISSLLILGLTGLFNAGGPVLLLTDGAAQTSTISYWIYNWTVNVGPAGYNRVSAAGLIFTAIGVPLILVLRKLIERIPTVEF